MCVACTIHVNILSSYKCLATVAWKTGCNKQFHDPRSENANKQHRRRQQATLHTMTDNAHATPTRHPKWSQKHTLLFSHGKVTFFQDTFLYTRTLYIKNNIQNDVQILNIFKIIKFRKFLKSLKISESIQPRRFLKSLRY